MKKDDDETKRLILRLLNECRIINGTLEELNKHNPEVLNENVICHIENIVRGKYNKLKSYETD